MTTPRAEVDEATVRAAAAEVYTPEGVDIFMDARTLWFGGLTPCQMIEAGRGQDVLDLIEGLADGVMG